MDKNNFFLKDIFNMHMCGKILPISNKCNN